MSKKSEYAKELFECGYNCAQAVFCAFCEDFGINFEQGLKLASSFGGGMGKLREVCGAVSAMFMIAGLKYGYSSPVDYEAKTKHYELIQNLANNFKEKHKSIICRELLGLDSDGSRPAARNEDYYKTRPCTKFIQDAVLILEDLESYNEIKNC